MEVSPSYSEDRCQNMSLISGVCCSGIKHPKASCGVVTNYQTKSLLIAEDLQFLQKHENPKSSPKVSFHASLFKKRFFNVFYNSNKTGINELPSCFISNKHLAGPPWQTWQCAAQSPEPPPRWPNSKRRRLHPRPRSPSDSDALSWFFFRLQTKIT